MNPSSVEESVEIMRISSVERLGEVVPYSSIEVIGGIEEISSGAAEEDVVMKSSSSMDSKMRSVAEGAFGGDVGGREWK